MELPKCREGFLGRSFGRAGQGEREDAGGTCPVSGAVSSSAFPLRRGKFRLNMRKNFFPLRVTEPWPRLPREVVESPSLEIFKTCLAAVLCSLLWVTLLRQEGWTR